MDNSGANSDEAAGRVPAAPVDFARFGDRDARDLIAEYPLALVSSRGADGDDVTLLPLIAECDDAGKVVRLIGHMARRNPLAAAFAAGAGASILFLGPHAYISPSLAGRSNWAPTWNYSLLRIEGDVEISPDLTEESLQILLEAMEGHREQPWNPAELGARYEAMKQQIIGFTVEVTRMTGRFKLGQDEPADILNAILADLPDPELARWMRRFNGGRE